MVSKFILVFDDVMVKQLRKVSKNKDLKVLISKMLDRLELLGPLAGELLDPKLFLYEIKNMRPPIRLYYKHNKVNDEIYIFEFEMKTSTQKQKDTIKNLRNKYSKS